MTAKTDRAKLIERVQKLLSLGNSTNPAESASALAKVQELMAENGLSGFEMERAKVGESRVRSTQSVSKPKDWENALVCAVGRAFACDVLWEPGNSNHVDYWGRYVFVGPRDYVELAEFAAVSLVRQLVKAKADRNRELNAVGRLGRRAMSAELGGFCWGWVQVVSRKVEAFAKETSPEFRKLVEDYCLEMTGGREARGRRSAVDPDAFRDGQRAAGEVQIHRPMRRGEEVLQIGRAS